LWSPDSRSIAFFAGGALKRLDLGGGTPQTVAPVVSGQGATWNADGVMLFAPTTISPLMRVPVTGGEAKAATTLGPQQSGHRAPCFLPDGGRFLFFAMGAPDAAGIYLGALDGRAPTRLTPGDGGAAFLPDRPGPGGSSRGGGWLLWVRSGMLVAQQLDVEKAALIGEPLTLADGVATDGESRSAVSVATAGLMAYRTDASSQRRLTWFDRSGTARGTVGDPEASLARPRVSRDGRRVAVARTVQGNTDVWLLDGVRANRLTFDAAVDSYPVWSPDGSRIAFSSNRTGRYDLYQVPTLGGVEERLIAASDQLRFAYSWSVDGRLLYSTVASQGNVDLWIVPMAGDRRPRAFLNAPFREAYGGFSPDGLWVAYQSNESGRPEVYVRPVAPPGAVDTAAGQWQVSTAGGVFPAWRPDGKELYYLNPAGVMMAASITVTGTTLASGAPVALFPTRVAGGGVDTQQGRQYDVGPDGRFLINLELDSAAAPITLLMNWKPEGRK
jgi:Tol biopolymer transport system component